MDLIDRERLKEVFKRNTGHDYADLIDNAPIVDAVPMSIIDEIKAEIIDEADFAYSDFDRYKEEVLGVEFDELPDDDFRYGLERAFDIINRKVKKQIISH